jgi:hypothetical protein
MGVKLILLSLREEYKLGMFAEENIWIEEGGSNMGRKKDYKVRNAIN